MMPRKLSMIMLTVFVAATLGSFTAIAGGAGDSTFQDKARLDTFQDKSREDLNQQGQ